MKSLDSGKFVLKFGATWCGPCKTIKPHFDKMKSEFPDIEIIDIDTDDNKDLVKQYSIRSVPTTVFVHDGKIVNNIVGSMLITALRSAFIKLNGE